LQTAEEIDCDLIVMATHGRTGLSRWLLGSVTEQVMRRSLCPVLTVKSPVARREKVSDQAAARAATVPFGQVM
jgi:hypothetical protein